MKKLVFVTDKLIPMKKAKATDVTELFEELKEYDISVTYVENQADMSWDDFSEYATIMEKEGVEGIADCEELIKEVADADFLITHFSPISSRVIEAGKKLQFIGVMRSGCENLTLKAATERGIKVSVAAGRLADPVADFTVGILLSECRNIARMSIVDHNGEWMGEKPANFQFVKCLRNKWVGIIGLGIIGKNVAQRLAGFGVKLMAYDPYCSDADFEKYNCKSVSLEELMSTADFVCVHYRLTSETEGMISKELIGMMKPSAFFVNTARAGLVDENALIKALKEHKIAGAALDVFSSEPLAEDSELKKLDNVTLTPHIAGGTSDQAAVSMTIILDELKRFLNGEKLVNERVFR